MIDLNNVSKTFTLHNQGSAVIEVISNVSFTVAPSECVALTMASGAGKSTLMRMIYFNYLTQAGESRFGGLDIVRSEPRDIIKLRRDVLGYVSRFLRVMPRFLTLDVVAEPLRALRVPADEAQDRSSTLLTQLNIPERLWSLSPTTFLGREQQRVNIARGFTHTYPAMLLDEPITSLDAANRKVVLSLIEDAKARGAAIIGIFYDEAARTHVCDHEIDVDCFTSEMAA